MMVAKKLWLKYLKVWSILIQTSLILPDIWRDIIFTILKIIKWDLARLKKLLMWRPELTDMPWDRFITSKLWDMRPGLRMNIY